jgi:hypothetical protein
MHNVFPFQLPERAGIELFLAYVRQHREQLDEQYGGHACFTTVNGVTGNYKLFGWYEVDVTVLSPTEVRFTTYGMESMLSGGRGRKEHEIPATAKPSALAEAIEARRQAVAAAIYIQRQEAERERLEREAIAAVYNELFGEPTCTSNA